jgi:16S rRNA C967 or C1407 C5-methylase (RsmB/RsmF family)
MLRGTGFVIALDKNKYKIDRIIKNAKLCGVERNIRPYSVNSTKLEGDLKPEDFRGLPGQGFGSNVFDRIMLDPPCTGFGQRPTFSTTKDVQEVRSFRDSQPAYQIRLISQAVRLLKCGGTMVYSTCTVSKSYVFEADLNFLTHVLIVKY